ncbi:peptidase domain-containing ABC transporter [Cellvibrio sp.]|uniref:peptidase domain-containing ABC transporter n=1 Tax=Cellvibrio sp. TaxID=1965322 RepID=UPI00396480A5
MNSRVHIQELNQRPENLLNFTYRRRLPIIIQTEVAECGLVCLAMISGYHGFETDMTSLRRKFSVSSHGVNLKSIMDIATRLHLAPRALRVDVEELVHVQLPCILHWSLNHFVVLKSIRKNSYTVHDPALGERTMDASSFNKEFTGIVLELTPTQEFEKGEAKEKLKLGHFWSSIVGLKRSLAQVVLLSLLLQIFALASPFYMQTIVDDVLPRQDTNLLIVLALGFGLLTLIQIGTTALREFVILHLSNRLGMQMSANLFRHLIRLPMDYFSKRHMGDIVSRFGALGNVRSLLTTGLIATVVDGLLALITLAAMFYYDARLALIVIFVVAMYGLLRWLLYRPFRLRTEESIVASAKESSHFMESVRAIQTIKLFQKENDRQHQWQNLLANAMNKNIHIARWGIGYSVLNGLLFGAENILVVYFAATAVMDNVISLGMLYAFMSYKSRFINSMDSLIAQWIEFKMLGLYLNRLADIAFTQPEDIDSHTVRNLNEVTCLQNADESIEVINLQEMATRKKIVGKIEVKNLAYRYGENEAYVFKNVNFVIHPGETVAITGASGCGKTTLLKCLMGLMEPTEGEIFVDDKPLKKISYYRSQIAAVMQEDQLLSGDIAENIGCFAPNINLNRVQECAHMACIHQEINNMPMNYNTLVGDMGTSLSGGQKQRVILARALYRKPRILFMDEATSHLDVNNETLVNENIKQLDITRVIVAHRPETVKSAGRQINLACHGG